MALASTMLEGGQNIEKGPLEGKINETVDNTGLRQKCS